MTFEKTGFRQKLNFGKNNFLCKKNIFLSFGDIFLCSNTCAIQINQGNNYLLKKTARENGLLAKGIRIWKKKVRCFKAPLGSLGLTIILILFTVFCDSKQEAFIPFVN